MDTLENEQPHREPVIVLAEPESLSRLGRESRLSSLAGLALGTPDQRAVFPFVGVRWSECELPPSNLGQVEAAERDTRLAELAARLVAINGCTVVVYEHHAAGDLTVLRKKLDAAIALVRSHARFEALDQARWTLVVVCHADLTAEDNTALEGIKGLCFLAGRTTPVFPCCHVMTRQLGRSRAPTAVFSRDIWPIAVGRLLVARALQGYPGLGEQDKDRWFRTWVSGLVSILPDHPRYEQFLLANANLAIEPTPFGSSVLLAKSRQTKTESALRETKGMQFDPIVTDKVPASASDTESSPADEPGCYAETGGPSFPDFVGSSPSEGAEAAEGRCNPRSGGWRERFRKRSIRFRVDRDQRQTSPFGKLSGDGSDAGSPVGLVRSAWESVRESRWNLVWYSEAQACEQFELAKLLRAQEEGWRAFLDYETQVEAARKRLLQISAQQDEARSGFVALWARLLIAIAACLFVGFAVTSVIAVATGSQMQAIVWGGAATAIGALLTTVILMALEIQAGNHGAQFTERALAAMEGGIAESLRLRLGLLAGADGLRRKSIWMATSARIRRLALRAKQIYKRASEDALASRRQLLDSLDPLRRGMVQVYLDETTQSVSPEESERDLDLSLEYLEGVASLEDSPLHQAIVRSFEMMDRAWNDVSMQSDKKLQGNLSTQVAYDAVFAAALKIRRSIEAGSCAAMMDKYLQAGGLENTVQALSDQFVAGTMLSVATHGNATGMGQENPPALWHGLHEGSFGIETATYRADLIELAAALAFVHREQQLTAELTEGIVRFRIIRAGGGGG